MFCSLKLLRIFGYADFTTKIEQNNFHPSQHCIHVNIQTIDKARQTEHNATFALLPQLKHRKCNINIMHDVQSKRTLDARGLLVRQRRGASEQVVLVGERPLAQAVKSFERADPITLPFISPESKFDPGNLIGRLTKRFLKGLLLVKCAMILAKLVLPKCENSRLHL